MKFRWILIKKKQKGITDQKKKKEADGGQADLSAQDLKLAAILGIQNKYSLLLRNEDLMGIA